MRPTLPSEIEAFLRERGTSTANEIALGVRARRDDVDEILKGDAFRRVAAPNGCSPRATYFNLSYLVPGAPSAKRPPRAELLFDVLRDGLVHSREEIFERVGFMLTNNAASELRQRGYTVEHRFDRRIHTYRLVLDEAATDSSGDARPRSQSVAASSSTPPEAAA